MLFPLFFHRRNKTMDAILPTGVCRHICYRRKSTDHDPIPTTSYRQAFTDNVNYRHGDLPTSQLPTSIFTDIYQLADQVICRHLPNYRQGNSPFFTYTVIYQYADLIICRHLPTYRQVIYLLGYLPTWYYTDYFYKKQVYKKFETQILDN